MIMYAYIFLFTIKIWKRSGICVCWFCSRNLTLFRFNVPTRRLIFCRTMLSILVMPTFETFPTKISWHISFKIWKSIFFIKNINSLSYQLYLQFVQWHHQYRLEHPYHAHLQCSSKLLISVLGSTLQLKVNFIQLLVCWWTTYEVNVFNLRIYHNNIIKNYL